MIVRLFFVLIISISLKSQNNVKSIDFDEYLNLSNSQPFLLVDIRTAEEHEISRLKNSININFYDIDFIDNIKKLNNTKSILLYCRSGRRSYEAVKILSKKGYLNIYDLKGGILALDKSLLDFDTLNN